MFINVLFKIFTGKDNFESARIVGFSFLAGNYVFENFHWKRLIMKVWEDFCVSSKMLIVDVWEGNIGQWEKLSENYLANEPVCDLTQNVYFQEKSRKNIQIYII